MTTDLRALLNEVAAGRLAPSRAAEMLDDLPGGQSGSAERTERTERTEGTEGTARTEQTDSPYDTASGGAGDGPEPAALPDGPDSAGGHEAGIGARVQGVDRVRVSASARPVRIIGDPTVATVTVDGPHTVTADGSVLRIEAGAGPAAATAARGSYSYERKTGLSRWLAQAGTVGVPLTVRMNPALFADAELLAGSLEIVGLAGPVAFSVTAGSLRLHDCSGVVNGVVRAGSAVLQVRPTAGSSSVRVESGSVDVGFLPGSDVRVNGKADLGEFKVRGGDGSLKLQKVDSLPEYVLGAGTASFDLHISMGSAKVRLP